MTKTTCLETSKKLKAAGFRQDTFFKYLGSKLCCEWSSVTVIGDLDVVAAQTSDEILEELPKDGTIHILPWMDDGAYSRYDEEVFCGYAVWYRKIHKGKVHAWNKPFKYSELVESLAACWLWLDAKGLLEGKKT